jgi:hypothetical protein
MADGEVVADTPAEEASRALEGLDVYLPPASEW